MKRLAVAGGALLLLVGVASGQWLEKTIWLPDSFGGLLWPLCAAVDTLDNKVYVSGGCDLDSDSFPLPSVGWVVVLDGNTYERIGRVSVVEAVEDLCWNPASNQVYCMHRYDAIRVIDCASDSVVAELECADRLFDICVNAEENKVYVLAKFDSAVVVIDGATNQVTDTIDLGVPAHFLFFYTPTNRLYCGFRGSGDRGIVVVDGKADTLVATLALDRQPWAMCGSPARELVFCSAGVQDGVVIAIDPVGDSVVRVQPIGTVDPVAICYNPTSDRVYCAGYAESLYVLTGTGDSVVGVIAMPYEYARHPMQMACSPVSNRVYYAGQVDARRGLFAVVDCGGDSLLAVLPVGVDPFDMVMNPVSNTVGCLNKYSDDLTVADCAGDSVLTRVILGARPLDLCYCENERKVYVASKTSAPLYVIDENANGATPVVRTGRDVHRLCYNPVLGKLYATGIVDSSVCVIDCRTDSMVATVLVGHEPGFMCFSPVVRTKVFVANGNIVSAIDCSRDSLIARIVLDGQVSSLVANNRHHKVYCADGPDGTVIDAWRDSTVSTFDSSGTIVRYSESADKWYKFPLGQIDVMDGASDSLLASVVSTPMLGANCYSYNTREEKAYFGSAWFITVIDGRADTLLAVIEVPGVDGLSDLCYNAADNKVYAAFGIGSRVAVIDGETEQIVKMLDVGTSPAALAWDPRHNRVYVADYYSSSISVFRDSAPGAVSESERSFVRQRVASLVRGSLLAPASTHSALQSAQLWDISGRRVAELCPGPNDVSHLAPGVYFLRSDSGNLPQRVVLVQ